MAYEYDIFISYKRDPETLHWIKKHLEPLLKSEVGLARGHYPKVYVNEVVQQVPAGAAWPQALGDTLGASRVLVALWTKTYFNSEWCTRELAHMLGRQEQLGSGPPGNGYRLVIPAVIHDGEAFPGSLAHIQSMDLKACYNPRMRRDGRLAEELTMIIRSHAQGIADAIDSAPEWDFAWPQQAADAFFQQFYAANSPVQTEIPKFQPT